MNIMPLLFVVFIGLWVALINSEHEFISQFALYNGFFQAVLFLFVASIPLWKTGRMSYVDIAWPFGVALTGSQVLFYTEGEVLRSTILGGIYLAIGLRMGIAALIMARRTGIIFNYDFPRYDYRRLMLEQSGTKHPHLHMQMEVWIQGLANASVLAIPAILIATNDSPTLLMIEIIGFGLWGVAYVIESIADTQKLLFISRNPKNSVCNIGLWRLSRHPNYFAEWLVWCGLSIAAIPSLIKLIENLGGFDSTVLLVGLFGTSCTMYICLVYLTGAKPAEFYSVQKRKDYKAYQKSTSIFFPWFPKN